MKKQFFAVFLFCFVSSIFGQTKKVTVGVLNGPSCIPSAYMMENFSIKSSENVELVFEKYADPQTLLPKMLKNNVDIGFMPVNVAAKVYNSTNGQLICCGVSGLGNLKILTTKKNINKMTDLPGRTLFVAGQGATPEYLMRYLLKEYKYEDDKKGIRLDFSIPTQQLVPCLLSGKVEAILVPEPFATIAQIKSDEVKIVSDLQDEYCYFTGSQEIYPLTVMVVSKKFAEENKEILEEYLAAYKQATEWTVKHPVAAGNLSEKYDLGLAKNVVIKAIPVSNYTYVEANAARNSIEALLNLFLENNSSSIGGKIPDSDFYFN